MQGVCSTTQGLCSAFEGYVLFNESMQGSTPVCKHCGDDLNGSHPSVPEHKWSTLFTRILLIVFNGSHPTMHQHRGARAPLIIARV